MPDAFKIGDWRVEPELNRLVRESRIETLEPRLMRLLVLLAEHPGDLVSKDLIFETVWSGLAVTDESLSQAVSKLRKLLEDSPDDPAYIETIRKKGYRLIAEVRGADAAATVRRNPVLLATVAAILLSLMIGGQLLLAPDPVPAPPYLVSEPLTGAPGREFDPALSLDGRFMAYSKADNAGGQQIYVQGIGTGAEARQVTEGGMNTTPVFMPAGDGLAYLRHRDGRCEIVLLSLIDSAERLVGDCTGNSYPDLALSADGTFAAFSARPEGSDVHAIMLLNVASGTVTRLSTPPAGIWGDYDPAFTGDGRVVFARSVSEAMQDVYMVDLAGGPEARLTSDGRNIMGITATEDAILFASNRDGRYGIWSLTEGTRPPARLAISQTGIINPSFADGTLIFEAMDRLVAMQRVGFSGDTLPAPLLEFNAEMLHPAVSPDGLQILFSSNRSGFFEIWRAHRDGGRLQRLTDFRAGFTAHPKAAPDGLRIALDARPDGVSQLFTLPLAGGEPQALTGLDANRYAPSWTPDGTGLLFSRETEGRLELWQLDLATGQETQRTRTGGSAGQMAADGALYHTRPGIAGLWRLSPGEAEPDLVIESISFSDWGNWQLSGGDILYFDRSARALKRFNIETGSEHTLAAINGYVPTADPAIAFDPDGMSAVITVRRRLESDIERVALPGS